MKSECVVPEAVLEDENAIEMARIFIAKKQLWCSMHVGMYAETNIPEGQAWGIILADMVRHLADALCKKAGADHDRTIAEVKQSFFEELGEPTSKAAGDFV